MSRTRIRRSEFSRHLVSLLEDCEDIQGAVVATADGHAIAAHGRDGTLPSKQLAAMSSTLLGLGDSISDALRQGVCRNVLVENELGTILVLHAGEGMVLMSIAEGGAKLGMALSHSRKAAEAVGTAQD